MKIKLTGMTCVHCEIFLKKVISNVPGVIRVVEVNHKTGEAIIEGDPDPQILVTLVQQHGYGVEIQ